MFTAIEGYLIPFLEQLYAQMGYVGLVIAMAIESAGIPLPSELILPMAGWMVSLGEWNLWLAVVFATLGNTLGSTIAYWGGALGGRPAVLRYGRYILISPHDVAVADRWFARWGEWAVFFSRLMPVVRTFISLPAGIARMHFGKFLIYSIAGALPWSFLLIYAGKLLGDNWERVRSLLSSLDYVIIVVIVALAAFYIYHHLRRSPIAD
ncbi:MAG: DedA family protein [Chloroflexi bacterium]|nr:DedA family protein [Chloroflexota bacterium]